MTEEERQKKREELTRNTTDFANKLNQTAAGLSAEAAQDTAAADADLEAVQKNFSRSVEEARQASETRKTIQDILSKSVRDVTNERLRERLGFKGKSIPGKALAGANWASAVITGLLSLDPMAYRSRLESSVRKNFDTEKDKLVPLLNTARQLEIDSNTKQLQLAKTLYGEKQNLRRMMVDLLRTGIRGNEKAAKYMIEAEKFLLQDKLAEAREALMKAQQEHEEAKTAQLKESGGLTGDWLAALRATREPEKYGEAYRTGLATKFLPSMARMMFAPDQVIQNRHTYFNPQTNQLEEAREVFRIPRTYSNAGRLMNELFGGRNFFGGLGQPQAGQPQQAKQPQRFGFQMPMRGPAPGPSPAPSPAQAPAGMGGMGGTPIASRRRMTTAEMEKITRLDSAKRSGFIGLSNISKLAASNVLPKMTGPVAELKWRLAQYDPDLSKLLFSGMNDSDRLDNLEARQRLITAIGLNVMQHAQGVGARAMTLITQFQDKMAKAANSGEAMATALGAYNAVISYNLALTAMPQYTPLLDNSKSINRIGDYYSIQSIRALSGLGVKDLTPAEVVQLAQLPDNVWLNYADRLQKGIPVNKRVRVTAGGALPPHVPNRTGAVSRVGGAMERAAQAAQGKPRPSEPIHISSDEEARKFLERYTKKK